MAYWVSSFAVISFILSWGSALADHRPVGQILEDIPVCENPIRGTDRGDYRYLVRQVMPAMVAVSVEAVSRNPVMDGIFPGAGDPFGGDQGWSQPMPGQPGPGAPGQPPLPPGAKPVPPQAKSAGSGTIITPDGYVLTNHHVIADAKRITVTVYSETEGSRVYDAHIVGSYKATDTAILKIDSNNEVFHTIPWAKDETVVAGAPAVVIGGPYALDFSVSVGTISHPFRDRTGIVPIEAMIQIDAATNPGNSGGALINECGELVGVNTAIMSRSGGSNGIGFAVPRAIAQPIAEVLMREGKVTPSMVGIKMYMPPVEKMNDLHLVVPQKWRKQYTRGIRIDEVVKSGPAEQAGLQVGDVIVEVEGLNRVHPNLLKLVASVVGPGKDMTVKVLRESELITMTITMADGEKFMEQIRRGKKPVLGEGQQGPSRPRLPNQPGGPGAQQRSPFFPSAPLKRL